MIVLIEIVLFIKTFATVGAKLTIAGETRHHVKDAIIVSCVINVCVVVELLVLANLGATILEPDLDARLWYSNARRQILATIDVWIPSHLEELFQFVQLIFRELGSLTAFATLACYN